MPSRRTAPWQQEFEDAFPYTETDDQLQAIRDIKADMEQPRPMDRLLCGDVGYGKTEVALRAVMKCILDGKQAAILVPTTVLAQQHYATAVNRFRSFPVNIEVLSRFRTPAQVRDILARTAGGKGGPADRHPQASAEGPAISRTWGCWSSTRSSASALPTRKNSGSGPGRWTP